MRGMSFQADIFSRKELAIIVGVSTVISVILFIAYVIEK